MDQFFNSGEKRLARVPLLLASWVFVQYSGRDGRNLMINSRLLTIVLHD